MYSTSQMTSASSNKPPTAYSPYHPAAAGQMMNNDATSPNRDFVIKTKKTLRTGSSAAQQRM